MDTKSAINKMLGNKTEGMVNKILGGETKGRINKMIGKKDTDSDDRKIKGTVCKRCGGAKTIQLGRNTISCPVCKGKGKY